MYKGITRYVREKGFCKTSFQAGRNLKKGQKQGRLEWKQAEDYPATEPWKKRKTRTLPYICKKYTAHVVVFFPVFSGIIL